MFVDHFDGKSLRRRSDSWLMSAIADAELKRRDCVPSSPAHEAMWRGIAEKYVAEQVRRDMAKH